MFTGIVEGIGLIKKIQKQPNATVLWIQTPFSLKDSQLGDSIAIDGCCLTVTEKKARQFRADISPETLEITALSDLTVGATVNVERPLRLGDRLGGHLVQGHVDGVGKIVSKEFIKAKSEGYFLIKIQIPKILRKYMIPKGSITVDGISLTVNSVTKTQISLCIIPHTQEKTTLTRKNPGDRVNLEADMILKFLEERIRHVTQ